MAITSFINYEVEIDFKPVYPSSHPNAGDEIGISFKLKSRECDAAKAIENKYARAATADQVVRQVNKEGVDDYKLAERLVDRMFEKMPEINAACIVSWDLAGDTLFDEDGSETKFTQKNKIKLLTDRRSAWLADQINAAIDGIAVFTKA